MKKILVCLLGFGLAAQVLAVPPRPNRAPLTPAEIARIKASKADRQRNLTPAQQEIHKLTSELRAEMKKKPVDQAKVNSLVSQINTMRDAQQIDQLQSELDNNKSLTAQQRQRYTDMIKRAKARQPKPVNP